ASTAARALCAARSSSIPTRAPPARMAPTRSASFAVTLAPASRRLPAAASDTLQHPALSHPLDVLSHLERHAERLVQVDAGEGEQCLRPGDRLADARELVKLLGPQPGDGATDAPGYLIGHPWEPRVDDLGLALGGRVVDPVVEAATLERVVELTGAVGGDH